MKKKIRMVPPNPQNPRSILESFIMKYLDEFRDPELARVLFDEIRAITTRPWAMMEVYMLGLLVAISKLSQMATITMGIAFWAFVALIVISTAASATMDPRIIWQRVEAAQ
jgi:uncharacterized paraquat-inducible protein A